MRPGRVRRAPRRSVRYFDIPFDPDATLEDPISITKDEFLDACDQLVAAGLPVREDREDAWKQFRGWRVNYDSVLVGLAGFLMAPYTPWSSDRSLAYRRPRLRRRPAPGPRMSSEDPGLGRLDGRVEPHVPLGAERDAERVVGEREEERSGPICEACAAIAAALAVDECGDVDGRRDALGGDTELHLLGVRDVGRVGHRLERGFLQGRDEIAVERRGVEAPGWRSCRGRDATRCTWMWSGCP